MLSSEARDVLGVRPPADVVNLMAVWGLGRERGEEALGANPRGVVVNEGIKRSSFRGVVDVVYGGEREVVELLKEKSVNGTGIGKKGKRKVEETENADSAPTISKRQAKKMRLEALKASKESSSPTGTTPREELTGVEESDTPSTIKAKANG